MGAQRRREEEQRAEEEREATRTQEEADASLRSVSRSEAPSQSLQAMFKFGVKLLY